MVYLSVGRSVCITKTISALTSNLELSQVSPYSKRVSMKIRQSGTWNMEDVIASLLPPSTRKEEMGARKKGGDEEKT